MFIDIIFKLQNTKTAGILICTHVQHPFSVLGGYERDQRVQTRFGTRGWVSLEHPVALGEVVVQRHRTARAERALQSYVFAHHLVMMVNHGVGAGVHQCQSFGVAQRQHTRQQQSDHRHGDSGVGSHLHHCSCVIKKNCTRSVNWLRKIGTIFLSESLLL